MKYLLIISHDDVFTPTETLVKTSVPGSRNGGRGIRVYGNPLRPPSEATTVRVREGKMMLTNGPFAKSRRKSAAYELIESSSPEEAIDVASTHPMAKVATIEVKPIWTELVVHRLSANFVRQPVVA